MQDRSFALSHKFRFRHEMYSDIEDSEKNGYNYCLNRRKIFFFLK
jgi:hypothetical protein